MRNSYKFYRNTECEYFPCHNDIFGSEHDFNCMFCFCPLYTMEDCKGNYKTLPNGRKDCSECLFPHNPDHYDYIMEKLQNA